MKVLFSVFTIVGVVFGSGFISGKELVVYFARFGIFSLPFLLIVFALFFLTFKKLLNVGDNVVARLKKSHLSFCINLISSVIFASAMFGADRNLINFDNILFNFLIIFIIFIICFLVYKKGIKYLNKLNFYLIPLSLLFFVILLFKKIDFYLPFFDGNNILFSPIYNILYVALNLSTGAVLIASLGKNMTKRQKAQASFISALVLCIVLLLAIIVLLQNPFVFSTQMPLLSLFQGKEKIIFNFIILIGCNTTLFSLVYSISFSMRGLCNNEFLIFSTSIILPYLIGYLGFGFIVSYLYPLASVLGLVFLFDIILFKNTDKSFCKSFFKRTNKKIHSSGKNTK